MSRSRVVFFNPPPGWQVQKAGFIPSMSWSPPDDWPPIPVGWPLFLEFKAGRMWAVFSLTTVGFVGLWGELMWAMGKPLPQDAFVMVAAYFFSFMVTQRLLMLRPRSVPPSRWPWVPTSRESSVHAGPFL